MTYNTQATIQEIGQLNFSGHMIPHTWYQHIKLSNGKADLIAIMILADIVYWYRPSEIKNEYNGQLLGFKKKFKADMFQRSSRAYANLYGISQRQASDAIKRLCDQGLIIREFRQIETPELTLSNVQFLAPIANAIAKIQIPTPILPDKPDDLDQHEDFIPFIPNEQAYLPREVNCHSSELPQSAKDYLSTRDDAVIGATLTPGQQELIKARVKELHSQNLTADRQQLIQEIHFILLSHQHLTHAKQDFHKKLNTICKIIRAGKWTLPAELAAGKIKIDRPKNQDKSQNKIQDKNQKWHELILDYQHWSKIFNITKNKENHLPQNLENLKKMLRLSFEKLVSFQKKEGIKVQLSDPLFEKLAV